LTAWVLPIPAFASLFGCREAAMPRGIAFNALRCCWGGPGGGGPGGGGGGADGGGGGADGGGGGADGGGGGGA